MGVKVREKSRGTEPENKRKKDWVLGIVLGIII
jgi:hypothetical protein